MKEILLAQFKATFDNAVWFVPLTMAIDGLNAQQASLTINQDNNSIEQILHHLMYWNDLYLQRYKDKDFRFIEIDNNSTFNNVNKLDWAQTIDKIRMVFSEWENRLIESEETKLNSIVGNGRRTWHSVIGNLIIHNAYHIGQIVAIRKFHNCWDKEKGVN